MVYDDTEFKFDHFKSIALQEMAQNGGFSQKAPQFFLSVKSSFLELAEKIQWVLLWF